MTLIYLGSHGFTYRVLATLADVSRSTSHKVVHVRRTCAALG